MTTLYGVIWRWWDLPGEGINHVESGMVLDSDREKAEAAAKDAIRRQRK
jgi:hypothetical protein